MRNGLLVLAGALLAGMAAFWAMRWIEEAGHAHGPTLTIDAMPELEWLKRDLELTDEQFVKVRDLHMRYRPKCAEMCRRIAEAHEKMEAIAAASREITPEYKSVLREHAEIHLESQEAMLKHLYETAAAVNQRQAERYLKTMLPFALDFTHSEPRNLHVR
jgi:hypothetical protein